LFFGVWFGFLFVCCSLVLCGGGLFVLGRVLFVGGVVCFLWFSVFIYVACVGVI